MTQYQERRIKKLIKDAEKMLVNNSVREVKLSPKDYNLIWEYTHKEGHYKYRDWFIHNGITYQKRGFV